MRFDEALGTGPKRMRLICRRLGRLLSAAVLVLVVSFSASPISYATTHAPIPRAPYGRSKVEHLKPMRAVGYLSPQAMSRTVTLAARSPHALHVAAQPHCEYCGGGGSGQAIEKTLTTTYGFDAQPLNWFQTLQTHTKVTLGSANGGLASSSDVSGGLVTLGTSAFGYASAEADQPLGVEYVPIDPAGNRLPAGTTVDLHVTAYVATQTLVGGISGIGVSCGQTYVNFGSPTMSSTDTLTRCLTSLSVAVPVPGEDETSDVGTEEDAGQTLASDAASSAADAVANSGEYGSAGSVYQDLHDVKEGVDAAKHIHEIVTGLMKSYRGHIGKSHLSVFTWNGTATGGSADVFEVDPQVAAIDSGGGVEFNLISSAVVFVITEQYAMHQGTYMFPVSEVSRPLLDPQIAENMTVTLPNGSTLPPGLQIVDKQQGNATIEEFTGTPSASGVYHFNLEIGTFLLHCTMTVAPPLAMIKEGNGTITLAEGSSQVPGANLLPVFVSGGVGSYEWRLKSAPKGLNIASEQRYGPPTLQGYEKLPPGVYHFTVQVSDMYTTLGQAITLVLTDSMTAQASPLRREGNGSAVAEIRLSVVNNMGPVAGDSIRFTQTACGHVIPNPVVTGTSGQARVAYVSCSTARTVLLRFTEKRTGDAQRSC